jgi:hypothetical protein
VDNVGSLEDTYSLRRPDHSLFAYFHRVNPRAGDGEVFMGFCSGVPHLGSCGWNFGLGKLNVKKIMQVNSEKEENESASGVFF